MRSSLLQLTDGAVWRPLLAQYAAATSLATALTDADGRMLTQTGSRPTWSMLREAAPLRDGDCPFCLRPTAFRLCVDRLTNGMTHKQDWGLAHFAIPLAVDGQTLAVIFAGQVFTSPPDRFELQRVAKQLGISPSRLVQTARDEIPLGAGSLEICRRLLDTLATSFLESIHLATRKDEFLATVSHELRSPLTTILGWIPILRSGRLDETQVANAMEIIERNALEEMRMVEELLQMSGAIAGKFSVRRQKMQFIPVIDSVVDALRPAVEAKRISVESELDEDANWISGDPDRLQQVVRNLLSNAIKFTPPGGHVRIRLERAGPSTRFIVSDNGKGIRDQFLPRVFERFTQDNSSGNTKHRGWGLGLAIVRDLVELHGGSIGVSSDGEGKGAEFTVTLPDAA